MLGGPQVMTCGRAATSLPGSPGLAIPDSGRTL